MCRCFSPQNLLVEHGTEAAPELHRAGTEPELTGCAERQGINPGSVPCAGKFWTQVSACAYNNTELCGWISS